MRYIKTIKLYITDVMDSYKKVLWFVSQIMVVSGIKSYGSKKQEVDMVELPFTQNQNLSPHVPPQEFGQGPKNNDDSVVQ